ncbi:mRNA cap guanine-N7 methyltransferase 1 [Glycine soja]|uniref:mRNA (guanine-N(7))-methyltransferase n=1 Tax=Glycine soja TaxID=3848 RepID=A0A445HQK2_GLYSO|nr:mRNA cap guanine-N7 methyltransferase 1 [Glycine soja]
MEIVELNVNEVHTNFVLLSFSMVVYNFLEDEITKILKVADHYSARSNQTLKEREASPIIHLKKLNNWVRLDKVLVDDAPFDICSCQFALHYSWSIEARARQALANVSALLHPGGIFIGTMPDANVIIKKLREAEGLTFGNRVYWVRFDEEFSDNKFKSSNPFGIKYTFHLEDVVDCPKWIVLFHVFKSLAEGFSKASIALQRLVLLDYSFKLYMKKPEFVELMGRLDALGDGNQDQSTVSADEWEAAYL